MLMRSVVAGLLLASVGCASSHYYPTQPGIYAYWRNGQRYWVKDGQPLELDGTLGGLAEAMREVPEASQLARDARSSATAGNVWFASALALLVGGLVVGASDDDTRQGVGLGIAAGALVADFIALGFYQAASVHSQDAAALYNARLHPVASTPAMDEER